MRTRRLFPILMAVLLVGGFVTACGGDDDDGGTTGTVAVTEPAGTAGTAAPETGGGGGGGGGEVDCPAALDAAGTVNLTYQQMIQLYDDGQYASMTSPDSPVPLDPEAFLAAVSTLRALESVTPAEGDLFGPISDSLDSAQQAGEMLQQNVAAGTPFADGGGQELLDLANDSYVDVNANISYYLEAAGC